MRIANPINKTQHAFNRLCEEGAGNPSHGEVLSLLRESGRKISAFGTQVVQREIHVPRIS